MINAIKYIWQLPQNLLGLLVSKLLDCTYHIDDDYYLTKKYRFGVSLGRYIIFGGYWPCMNDIMHERGHCTQSLIFGWLYLIVIGLPSAIGNAIHRVYKFDYYKLPWEAWADKLGGVNRRGDNNECIYRV